MSTGINIAPSSDLTVGTTAVTSGTNGRVFFQAGGVVQQSASLFWDNTNARLGVGATPASTVRLDVRAQGALSTDIAFRVRNSADTADIFSIRGNNDIYLPAGPINNKNTIFHGSASLLQYSSDATQNIAIGSSSTFNNLTSYNTVLGGSASTGSSTNFAVSIGWSSFANADGAINIGRTRASGSYSIRIGYDGGASSYGGTNSIHLGRTVSANNITPDDVFMTYFNSQSSSTLTRANGSFGLLGQQAYIIANGTGALGLTTFMGDGGNTLVVRNHPNIPSTNITDSFQQYSADIVAGNAAPHFRTEVGDIIKLYKQSSAGITTVGDLVTILTNLGLLG
jgi:hypothetical protein